MKRAGGGGEEDVQVLVERPSSFSHEDRHQQQQGAASLPTSAAARAPHRHRKQQVIRARPYYRRWSPWLVSAATVACVAIFLVTMYVNDCPRHSSNCAAGFLGRFAFQRLLGPSSATYVHSTTRLLFLPCFSFLQCYGGCFACTIIFVSASR
jgi:hypothetical protein